MLNKVYTLDLVNFENLFHTIVLQNISIDIYIL